MYRYVDVGSSAYLPLPGDEPAAGDARDEHNGRPRARQAAPAQLLGNLRTPDLLSRIRGANNRERQRYQRYEPSARCPFQMHLLLRGQCVESADKIEGGREEIDAGAARAWAVRMQKRSRGGKMPRKM